MDTHAPPDITANIRAEVARSGVPVLTIVDHLSMAPSTWYRRMEQPDTWKWGELVRLALVLRIPVERLVSGVKP